MKNLVVGAGLTGAVIAERIATMLREEVTVIDKASHVGGMHYDYVDKDTNILVHAKHVNFLHTEHKFIWDYLSKFGKLAPVTFKPSVRIQGKNVSMPENGWTELIENILKNNKNIKLKLNTDFSDINPAKYDRIFFTGSIDEYFDYKHGELPYRSVRMDIDSKAYECCTHCGTYNWPYEYDFIRAHIFADCLPDKTYSGNKDIIGYEYIESFELGKNERFYPINNVVSNEVYAKYLEDASQLENVYFAGRLGEFKYYESDELVRRAFEIVASLVMRPEEPEDVIEVITIDEDIDDNDINN